MAVEDVLYAHRSLVFLFLIMILIKLKCLLLDRDALVHFRFIFHAS